MKTVFSETGISHYKDKTVMGLSYLYYVNSYTGTTASFYFAPRPFAME